MLSDMVGGAMEGISDMTGCLLVVGGAALVILSLIGLLSRLI